MLLIAIESTKRELKFLASTTSAVSRLSTFYGHFSRCSQAEKLLFFIQTLPPPYSAPTLPLASAGHGQCRAIQTPFALPTSFGKTLSELHQTFLIDSNVYWGKGLTGYC